MSSLKLSAELVRLAGIFTGHVFLTKELVLREGDDLDRFRRASVVVSVSVDVLVSSSAVIERRKLRFLGAVLVVVGDKSQLLLRTGVFILLSSLTC